MNDDDTPGGFDWNTPIICYGPVATQDELDDDTVQEAMTILAERRNGRPGRFPLADDQVDAYLKTEYWVYGSSRFSFRIGEYSGDLEILMHEAIVHSCAYFTAGNPRGQLLDEFTNRRRQTMLANDLIDLNYKFHAGFRRDPSGKCPDEHSYLVIGIDLQPARILSLRYEQNAMVWIGSDCFPLLVIG